MMRKILWLVTLLCFCGGIVMAKAGGEDTPKENENETQIYTVSTEPVFGDNNRKFVAHRGYSNGAPENTVPAFELAGENGFWGIETDIQESADGVFMCMHDEDIERTTDSGGAIGDYTYG